MRFTATGTAAYHDTVGGAGSGAVVLSASGEATASPHGGATSAFTAYGSARADVGRACHGDGQLVLEGAGRSACGRSSLGAGRITMTGRGRAGRGASSIGVVAKNFFATGYAEHTRATNATGLGRFDLYGQGIASATAPSKPPFVPPDLVVYVTTYD